MLMLFVMINLVFFINDQYYENLKNLIIKINEHAVVQKCAIVFDRIKKSKLKKSRKI